MQTTYSFFSCTWQFLTPCMYYLLPSPHPHSCFRTFLTFRTFLPFIATMCISNLIQINNTLTIQDTNKPRLTYSSRELRELADCMQHDNKYLVLNLSVIGNIHRFRINRTKGSTTKRQVKQPRGIITLNFIHIRTVAFGDKYVKLHTHQNSSLCWQRSKA